MVAIERETRAAATRTRGVEITPSISGKRVKSVTFIEPWYFTWRKTRRAFLPTGLARWSMWVRIAVMSAAAVAAAAWTWRTCAPGVPISGWLYAAPLVMLAQFAFVFALQFLTPRFVTVGKTGLSMFQGQHSNNPQAGWITRIRIRPTALGVDWLIVRYHGPRYGKRSIRAAISTRANRERLDAAIAQLLASRDKAVAAQEDKARRNVGHGWFASAR